MCFTKNSYDRWLNVLELCLYFVLIMFYYHSPSYEFECQDSLWGEKKRMDGNQSSGSIIRPTKATVPLEEERAGCRDPGASVLWACGLWLCTALQTTPRGVRTSVNICSFSTHSLHRRDRLTSAAEFSSSVSCILKNRVQLDK